MSILVGTASWTDKTLIESGAFYPPGCSSAEARLRYYSSVFQLVEVDSSYYAMPSATDSALWAERTPTGFVFDVKAFRLFTGHQTEPKFFPKDLQPELPNTGKKNLYYKDVPAPVIEEMWARFFAALRPLQAVGKLGAVLFQFPRWITVAPKAMAHVEHCAERAHTVWEVTSPELAIVRLHGRNAETWSGVESAAERFNYEYSDEELRELAIPIEAIAKRAGRTHVHFNNCWRDVA
ncbi:DUF72 domain-containing protein [Paraburkholderia kururiensis]|uniref:DUF72 domain-containing protein n=1 Tax=Paraburkholderia kururiensis TaxID=984307 RepID=UPI0005A7BFC0|nr:DUF72 domain-containing protein [Paraburkholderia kururiensis]